MPPKKAGAAATQAGATAPDEIPRKQFKHHPMPSDSDEEGRKVQKKFNDLSKGLTSGEDTDAEELEQGQPLVSSFDPRTRTRINRTTIKPTGTKTGTTTRTKTGTKTSGKRNRDPDEDPGFDSDPAVTRDKARKKKKKKPTKGTARPKTPDEEDEDSSEPEARDPNNLPTMEENNRQQAALGDKQKKKDTAAARKASRVARAPRLAARVGKCKAPKRKNDVNFPKGTCAYKAHDGSRYCRRHQKEPESNDAADEDDDDTDDADDADDDTDGDDDNQPKTKKKAPAGTRKILPLKKATTTKTPTKNAPAASAPETPAKKAATPKGRINLCNGVSESTQKPCRNRQSCTSFYCKLHENQDPDVQQREQERAEKEAAQKTAALEDGEI